MAQARICHSEKIKKGGWKAMLVIGISVRYASTLPRSSIITVIMGIRYYLACLRTYTFAHSIVNNHNHFRVGKWEPAHCITWQRSPLQRQAGLIGSGCLEHQAEAQQYEVMHVLSNDRNGVWNGITPDRYFVVIFYKNCWNREFLTLNETNISISKNVSWTYLNTST